jgi:hypothetical protein
MAEVVESELAACAADEHRFFSAHRVTPVKWTQSPWGDEGGGFWVLALCDRCVLWYNDIEGGFEVSSFNTTGVIPKDEYACNQETLAIAVRRMIGHAGLRGVGDFQQPGD